MNTDATPDITVDITAGAQLPALEWVIAAMLSLAGTLLIAALLLIAIPLRLASTSRVHP
jgi:hypothetical protein